MQDLQVDFEQYLYETTKKPLVFTSSDAVPVDILTHNPQATLKPGAPTWDTMSMGRSSPLYDNLNLNASQSTLGPALRREQIKYMELYNGPVNIVSNDRPQSRTG